ncbi:MAG: hypothetical protein ABIP48_02365 [Planctomycetota bacterium]
MSTSLSTNGEAFAAPSRSAAGLSVIGWFTAGCAAAVLFHLRLIPRLELVVCAMTAITVAGILSIKMTGLSLLPRLMVLLYSLPFSTTIGYLFIADYTCWPGQKIAEGYSQDHDLMSLMLMVAIVGLLGLLTGIAAGAAWFRQGRGLSVIPRRGSIPHTATLDGTIFLFLLAVAFILSWLATPKETILVAAYASAESSQSTAAGINLNSGCSIAYLILLLLFIDAERERVASLARRFKMRAVLSVSGYILVVHQLLRGSRTAAGLIAALAVLYLTSPNLDLQWLRASLLQRRRLGKLLLPLVLLLSLFLCIAHLRHSLSVERSLPSLAEVGDMLSNSFTRNTWTNSALTNLGLAVQITDEPPTYLHGQTYRDYVLSLPPGVLCKMIGYERPLESYRGPAWWYSGLAIGGVHLVVVPFKNFGIVGAFLILALYGAFLSYCEILNTTFLLWPRLLYGAVVSSSLHWFWYGDMYMVRGVMAAMLLAIFYNFTAKERQMPFSAA